MLTVVTTKKDITFLTESLTFLSYLGEIFVWNSIENETVAQCTNITFPLIKILGSNFSLFQSFYLQKYFADNVTYYHITNMKATMCINQNIKRF